MPNGAMSMRPYIPQSPIGSPDFPTAAGSLSLKPTQDDISRFFARTATDPMRSIGHGGADAYLSRKAELNATTPRPKEPPKTTPDPAFMLMSDLLKEREQRGGVGRQEVSPTAAPQAPQMMQFGEWMDKNYPQYAGRAVPVTLGQRLQQEYQSAQQAAQANFQNEMLRYQSQVEAARWMAQGRSQDYNLLNTILRMQEGQTERMRVMGGMTPKMPSTFEAAAVTIAMTEGPQHPMVKTFLDMNQQFSSQGYSSPTQMLVDGLYRNDPEKVTAATTALRTLGKIAAEKKAMSPVTMNEASQALIAIVGIMQKIEDWDLLDDKTQQELGALSKDLVDVLESTKPAEATVDFRDLDFAVEQLWNVQKTNPAIRKFVERYRKARAPKW